MKLELKHILPYLNHELKSQDIRTKEIRTVTLLHFTYDKETVGHNHLIYEGLLLSKHLPILRPLSDLNKEIEKTGNTYFDLLYYDFDRNGQNAFDFQYLENSPLEYPFYIVQKLLEWHFDIYGLIEQGLAIDINTLDL